MLAQPSLANASYLSKILAFLQKHRMRQAPTLPQSLPPGPTTAPRTHTPSQLIQVPDQTRGLPLCQSFDQWSFAT